MSAHKIVFELLAGYVLGELPERQAREVRSHVTVCQQCADELKRLEALLECTRQINRLSADEQMLASAKNRILVAADSNTKSKTIAQPDIGRAFKWRMIMKNTIIKLAAAAVVVLGAYLGIHFLGGPGMENVAWAEVTQRVAAVDYAHVYYFKSRSNVLGRHFEGWYAHGKLVLCGNEGDIMYDDGQTLRGFDKQQRQTVKRPSNFAGGQTFLEVFSGGLLSDKNEQFARQLPAQVGADFLIYKFDPSARDSDFIEGIFITVGRNSLLPVQVKVYHKDSDYDLITFDYEAPQKPAEFFEPPAVEQPHGSGTVLLDGQETMIAITGSPGIKTAVVRLHDKSSDDSGAPVFSLDVAFIVDEGCTSVTNPLKRLHLNEAAQCGLGADNWPDGKYRNIRFSPLLKPTDRADAYTVEIRCWLRTEKN